MRREALERVLVPGDRVGQVSHAELRDERALSERGQAYTARCCAAGADGERGFAQDGGFSVLDIEQVHAVARAAIDEQLAARCTVAAFTGLRQGEILALVGGTSTTMRYLHYVPQHDDAARLTAAFATRGVSSDAAVVG